MGPSVASQSQRPSGKSPPSPSAQAELTVSNFKNEELGFASLAPRIDEGSFPTYEISEPVTHIREAPAGSPGAAKKDGGGGNSGGIYARQEAHWRFSSTATVFPSCDDQNPLVEIFVTASGHIYRDMQKISDRKAGKEKAEKENCPWHENGEQREVTAVKYRLMLNCGKEISFECIDPNSPSPSWKCLMFTAQMHHKKKQQCKLDVATTWGGDELDPTAALLTALVCATMLCPAKILLALPPVQWGSRGSSAPFSP
eukprot:jgi/Mesen1/9903/ME000070S09187